VNFTGKYAPVRLNEEAVEAADGAYGLWLVCEQLRRRGATITTPDDSEAVILASIYWPEQLYELAAVRGRYQGRTIVAGGINAWTTPGAAMALADRIYVGDGEAWDGRLEGPYILGGGAVGPVAPAVEPVRPMCYESETQLGVTAAIELSRGCPRRCLYCQYSWTRPWRVADEADAMAALAAVTARKVAPRTVDRARVPYYAALESESKRRRLKILGGETSIRGTLEDPASVGPLRRYRVGVDGLSERLRRMVGKPATTAEIVEACWIARRSGIKQFMLYMIWGLPTETDQDAAEFDDLLDQLAAGPLSGLGSVIGWNCFHPNAMTPMQWCASGTDRDTTKLREIIARRRAGTTYVHRPGLQSVPKMVRRMVALRATEAAAPIIKAYVRRPSVARETDLVRREFERVVGHDPCGAWPVEADLPWDRFISYDRDKLEKIHRRRWA
jgi:hypothetical protein